MFADSVSITGATPRLRRGAVELARFAYSQIKSKISLYDIRNYWNQILGFTGIPSCLCHAPSRWSKDHGRWLACAVNMASFVFSFLIGLGRSQTWLPLGCDLVQSWAVHRCPQTEDGVPQISHEQCVSANCGGVWIRFAFFSRYLYAFRTQLTNGSS